jgi:hypothetical protein
MATRLQGAGKFPWRLAGVSAISHFGTIAYPDLDGIFQERQAGNPVGRG